MSISADPLSLCCWLSLDYYLAVSIFLPKAGTTFSSSDSSKTRTLRDYPKAGQGLLLSLSSPLRSVPFNRIFCSDGNVLHHTWLWSTWNTASEAEKLGFIFYLIFMNLSRHKSAQDLCYQTHWWHMTAWALLRRHIPPPLPGLFYLTEIHLQQAKIILFSYWLILWFQDSSVHENQLENSIKQSHLSSEFLLPKVWVRAQDAHFWHIPRCCWCCWSGDCALRTVAQLAA